MQNKTSVYLFVLIALIVGILIGMNTDKFVQNENQGARAIETQMTFEPTTGERPFKCDNGAWGDATVGFSGVTINSWNGPAPTSGTKCSFSLQGIIKD